MTTAAEALVWLASGFLSSCGLLLSINTYVLHLLPWQTDHAGDPFAVLAPPTLLHACGAALGELTVFAVANQLVARLPAVTRRRLMLASSALSTRPGVSFVVIYSFACWPAFFFDWCGIVSGVANVPLPLFLVATTMGKCTKGLVLLHAVRTNREAAAQAYPLAVLGVVLVSTVAAFRYWKKNAAHRTKQNESRRCTFTRWCSWASWPWRTKTG